MTTFLLRLVACLFIVVSSASHAALYDRGNGLIYDNVLDITWLQDANYAKTSGYAAANATDGGWNTGPLNVQSDGVMGWSAAKSWATQLEYGGYDNWRLPSAGDAPAIGFNTAGELGHMFYHELILDPYTPIVTNVSFSDATTNGGTESFVNVQSYIYWLGEEYPLSSDPAAWAFNPTNGYQDHTNKTSSHYVWPVHDGDIGAAVVPIPTTAWLFGSALAGLLVARRKNKK